MTDSTQDEEHLKLLSIFHYVVGGIAALFALFPIFHLIFGLVFILAPAEMGSPGEPTPRLIGWFFVLFAGIVILIGSAFAGLILATGRFLTKRKHHTFCQVVAGVECIFFPFGTVLGVFTIIVLNRDSVKQMFADSQAGISAASKNPERTTGHGGL